MLGQRRTTRLPTLIKQRVKVLYWGVGPVGACGVAARGSRDCVFTGPRSHQPTHAAATDNISQSIIQPPPSYRPLAPAAAGPRPLLSLSFAMSGDDISRMPPVPTVFFSEGLGVGSHRSKNHLISQMKDLCTSSDIKNRHVCHSQCLSRTIRHLKIYNYHNC